MGHNGVYQGFSRVVRTFADLLLSKLGWSLYVWAFPPDFPQQAEVPFWVVWSVLYLTHRQSPFTVLGQPRAALVVSN